MRDTTHRSDPQADLRGRSISGAKWIAVQKWYTKLAGLATTLLLARLLAPSEFGLAALAMAFVALASVVTEAGLAPSLVQAKSVSKREASTAFWLSIMLSTFLVVIVQLLAEPAAILFGEPRIEPLLRVLAVLMPITALSSVQMALLNRSLELRSLAIRQVVAVTAGVVAAVIVAVLGGGAWALVAQSLTAAVAGVVVLWASTRWRPAVEFSGATAAALLRQGSAVLGTSLVHQLRDRGDEFIIGGFLGAEALGLWTIGTRLTKVAIDLVYSVISGITFPVLSRLQHDRPRYNRAVEQGITLNLLLVVPALVGLAVLAPVLVPLFFGAQWGGSILPAQVYTAAVAIGVFQWLDSQIWWSQGKFKVEFWLAALISTAHLASVALAAQSGLLVVATAVLARTMITAPVRLFFLVRFAQVPLAAYRNAPRTVLATLIMAAAIWGTIYSTDDWPLLFSATIGILAGSVAYVLSSIVLQRTALTMLVDMFAPRMRNTRLRGLLR